VARVFTGLESPVHWLILGIIVLIVLGPKRLPEVGRSLGSGLRGFRNALSGEDEETKLDEPETKLDEPEKKLAEPEKKPAEPEKKPEEAAKA
jgi:sec-independent protein translocase protein TatA